MSERERLPDITALMARRLRCPNCTRRFRPQDISTVETEQRFGVFSLRCPMCNTERLVLASWTRNALRTFATDLDAKEWSFYRDAPPVNADDVLRVYQMLSNYEGDLSDVLEDPILDEQ